MTQYHNLDDSGDPGLGSARGSSSYLSLAMVQMAEHEPLPQLAAVRQQFHFPPTFEFKYHNTKDRHRSAFFAAIQILPFRVRAVVVDKSRLGNEFANIKGQNLTIELITHLTLRASELDIAHDILVIDGATPEFRRRLRVRLSEECRKTGRASPFAKIVSGDSRREDGLQLADMIAGAVRQYAIGDQRGYYQSFANKVIDLWQVPERGK